MATMMSSSAASIDRPTSAPPPAQNEPHSAAALSSYSGSSALNLNQTLSAANTALPSPAVSSFVGASNTSRAKGMQLGASKVPSSVLAAKLAEEIVGADPQTEENPWGTDDLIDINADQDDWSRFYLFEILS
jgi:SCY1-like protein 1